MSQQQNNHFSGILLELFIIVFQQVAPLTVIHNSAEVRGNQSTTESELLYRAALMKRLESTRVNSTRTSNSTIQDSENIMSHEATNRIRKFDLKQFLQNSVYPAEHIYNETDSDTSILNASHLVDHLHSSKQIHFPEPIESPKLDEHYSEQVQSNETIIDEELILNLTQKRTRDSSLLNMTLNDDEHEVLDILETLEDNEQLRDDQTCIDDDSLLAQISQAREPSQICNAPFEDEDSDDDLFDQLSMSMFECFPSIKAG